MVGKLETVLSVAMEEKQKTLRPEIQLLNRLLGAKTGADRTAVRNLGDRAKALCQQHLLLTSVA